MFEVYKELKHCGKYESNIFKRIKYLYDGSLYFVECCAVSGNQIAIDPLGSVYTCQVSRESSIGNINTISLKDIPSISAHKSIPIFNEFYQGCYDLPICGGGCPLQYAQLFGDEIKDKLWDIEYSICTYSKKLMDLFLLEIVEKTYTKE